MLSRKKLIVTDEMDREEVRQITKSYLELEYDFFQWIDSVTDTLQIYDVDENLFNCNCLGYPKINKTGIRIVKRFRNKTFENKFLKDFEELKQHYFNVFRERKRNPIYFPKFFKNIEQITITRNTAYESKLVHIKDSGFYQTWVTAKYNESTFKDLHNLATVLRKKGYRVEFGTHEVFEDILVIKVFLTDIMNDYNLETMSVKRESGHQYQCRIKKVGERKTQLHQYGFILLSYDSKNTEIFFSSNDSKRADFLERERNIIELPKFNHKNKINCLYNFYKVTSRE